MAIVGFEPTTKPLWAAHSTAELYRRFRKEKVFNINVEVMGIEPISHACKA